MQVIKPNPGNRTEFKSLLIYGETQSGKTSLLGTIARAYYQRTGKRTRLIMTDEGGFSAIAPEIDEGIIEVVSLVADNQPQSNLMWLAKGHFVGVDGNIDRNKPQLDNIGMVVLDSITSAAELVKNYFVQSGTKVAQDVVGLREEQGLKFGAPSMSHYGAVQQFILQLVTQFNSLPVDKVIYTALESKGTDSTDGAIILGPSVAGKALTGVLPSRINRILHLEIVPSPNKTDRTYRVYYRPHIDSTLGRSWPANLRLPLAASHKLQTHPEYGKGFIEFKTGGELLELFAFCDELVATLAKESEAQKTEAADKSAAASPVLSKPSPVISIKK